MADEAVAKAAKGIAAQRGKTTRGHQAVPGDAVSVAAGTISKGTAPGVTGGTMTMIGRGFLTGGGRKGPPT